MPAEGAEPGNQPGRRDRIMKLIWEPIHLDVWGALPSDPDNVLAHVWNSQGWRMSCAFAPDIDDSVIFSSAEAAQEKAQEAMDAWMTKHTLGWKGEQPETEDRIKLNARQLKELLALAAPDAGEEWLAHELIIQRKGHWVTDGGEDMPPGVYAMYFEQPGEGWYGPVKGGTAE